jgi:5-methylcytosine-specific restriction endonuclease McrA
MPEWSDKKINMELDHIDGNRTNHKLENLRMLCPNCHSQTDTYRAKNIK